MLRTAVTSFLGDFLVVADFLEAVACSVDFPAAMVTFFTTCLVVTVLFFMGGEVLRDFALALMLGVIVGSYSSIFVASPIVVEWEKKAPKRFK